MFNIFKILRSDLSEDSIEGQTSTKQRGKIILDKIKRNKRPTPPPLSHPQPVQKCEGEDDDNHEL